MAPSFPSLKSILLQKQYSDFTITCGGRTFYAHKAVVCPQSPFFEKALNGKFAESQSGNVTLEEEDPKTIERMLSFMYTGDYEDPEPEAERKIPVSGDNENGDGDSDNNHNAPTIPNTYARAVSVGYANIDLYVTADKFMMETLKEVAKDRFLDWFMGYKGGELADVIRKAFAILPPHDNVFREAIIQTVAHSWADAPYLGDDLFRVLIDYGMMKDVFMAFIGGRTYGDGSDEWTWSTDLS